MSVSCNPSDLANAARCFESCIPDQLAVRSLLMCNGSPNTLIGPNGQSSTGGNGSMGGCTQPNAPTNLISTGQTGSTITIQWNQTVNLFGSIVVRWGSAPGQYNIGSAGVGQPSSPTGTYTIPFLSSSTNYYIIVQAFNGSCGPVNSAELVQSTSGNVDPVVSAWSAQIITNGGSAPSQATLDAVNAFWTGLKTDGIDGVFLTLNVFAPDSLVACCTPLVALKGNVLYTNHGFLSANLSANGLQGDSSGKYLDTGFNAATDFVSHNSTGMTCYVRNPTDYPKPMCVTFTGPYRAWGMNVNFFGAFTGWDGTISSWQSGLGNENYGFFSMNRTASNLITDYGLNGSVAIQSTTGTTAPDAFGGPPNLSTPIFAFSNNGTIGSTGNRIVSFFAIHTGMTQAQVTALFNRVQTLRTAFGGGYT